MKTDFEQSILLNGLSNDLKTFESKKLYRCPYCEKIHEWDDVNYNPEDGTFTCPKCTTTYDETELENISMYDYIEEIYLTYKGVNNEIFHTLKMH